MSDHDSIDAAWAEAEAALPEGWMGPSFAEQTEGTWRAYVSRRPTARRREAPPEIVTVVGPTPAAALRALAAKLREAHDPLQDERCAICGIVGPCTCRIVPASDQQVSGPP